MHFGMYLKRRGVISAEQLVAALELQLQSLVPIGQLALEEGVLSARDIFDVLQAQSHAPRERFGDLAIELGLMKREDLMRLLMVQADRKRSIDEILVAQRVLSEGQATSELEAYRQSQLRPQRNVLPARLGATSRPRDRADLVSDAIITV